MVVLLIWVSRLADQPGQDGDDRCFCLEVEVLPDVQFLRRSFRFGPKGELALHVFSPPWSGLGALDLKDLVSGGESQLFYVHGGDGKEIQAWPI
jgi:hypothetical protein